MSKPTLVPFHVTHLTGLVNRDHPFGDPSSLDMDRQQGPAVTALVDGRVIGCAGLILPWPGIAQVWMILSEDIAPHKFWLTRTVRRMLRDWIYVYKLYRVEALALQESCRNQEWLELLGFAREQDGCARFYTPDRRNMIRYELVKGV